MLHAAIGLAGAAGDAVAAGEIGIDDADLAGAKPEPAGASTTSTASSWPITRGYCEERVLAFEDVIVGAADADAARADQHLRRRRPPGAGRCSSRSSPGSTQTRASMTARDGFRWSMRRWPRRWIGAGWRRPRRLLLELGHVVLGDQGGAGVDQRLDLLAADGLDQRIDAELGHLGRELRHGGVLDAGRRALPPRRSRSRSRPDDDVVGDARRS